MTICSGRTVVAPAVPPVDDLIKVHALQRHYGMGK